MYGKGSPCGFPRRKHIADMNEEHGFRLENVESEKRGCQMQSFSFSYFNPIWIAIFPFSYGNFFTCFFFISTHAESVRAIRIHAYS